MRFNAQRRVRKASEFQLSRTEGKQLTFGSFVFQWRPNDLPYSRLGVIASKRIGNAVYRALAKRRLRALFIRHGDTLSPAVDLVLIARRHLVTKPFAETETQFLTACRKAGLCTQQQPKE